MLSFNNIKKFFITINGQLIFTAIIFFIIGIYFRFEVLEVVRITGWVTRDFDRAFHLFDGDYIQLAGPERNAGGRLLGPFLYFFLTIPLFFDYSYESIYIFNLVLNIGSGIFFFWLILKYFGMITASISSILLSVNIAHLDSVGFPINPTFMLPLLFIFLWLVFKIGLDKKTSYIPWIFVTISLGIQMHFSMAAYYLVPVIICLLLKIKTPLKQIFIGIGSVGLCFIPYLIYKQQYYEPNIDITETFFNQNFTFLQILKIISLQNVLHRINQGNSLYNYYSMPDYIVQIEFLFSCISLYGLVLYIIFKLRKDGALSCKREIILFLLFYIPALIYEITNPPTGWHFWHYFIFIPPMILIKAYFCSLVFKNINYYFLKVFMILSFQFVFLYFVFNLYKTILPTNKFTSSKIKNGDFYNSKNLKVLIAELKNNLNFTLENFYIEGISINSNYFSTLKTKSGISRILKSKQKNCFYLSDINKSLIGYLDGRKSSPFLVKVSQRSIQNLKWFFSDPTIILDSLVEENIIIKRHNFRKILFIYPYKPKINQPCYTNTKNNFSVGVKINSYLKNSFNINKNSDRDLVIRPIKQKTYFSDSSLLEKLFKTDIIFNRYINTPIQTEISILKVNGKYKVRTDLLYYSWGKARKDYFKIKELRLKILGKKNSVEFPLIHSDSWVSNKVIDQATENFYWYREFELPHNIELKKDNFRITLSWNIVFPQNKEKCCLKFKTELEN